MKPAEQWIREDPMYAIFSELNYPVVINYIKAIQLDAWRRGIMEAKHMCNDAIKYDMPEAAEALSKLSSSLRDKAIHTSSLED